MFEREVEQPGRPGRVFGTVPGGGRFEVRDLGAQVISWTAQGDVPVVWNNPNATLGHLGDPTIVHGIPIAFPWVGTGRTGELKPEHGFARGVNWRLVRMFGAEGITTLEWRLSDADVTGVEGSRRVQDFEVTLTQRFGEQLRLTLSVRNVGKNLMASEEALHLYLHVGDVRQAVVHGLGGADYIGHRAGEEDTQVGPLTFDEELRRNYHSRASLTLHDPVLNRRIIIEKERSANTLIWSPGESVGRERADLEGAWKRFVRISIANTDRDMIHLQPGEAHSTRVRLMVEAD